jgi:hypothetical protein
MASESWIRKMSSQELLKRFLMLFYLIFDGRVALSEVFDVHDRKVEIVCRNKKCE